MNITRTAATTAAVSTTSGDTGSFGERLGYALGGLFAPAFALASAARGARSLHPEGVVLRGHVVATPHDVRYQALARSLEGPLFARLSAGLWREREWPDVLGIGLRFRRTNDISATPRDGDQDLLFATVRSPFTLPFAPLTTDTHDFFANDYYAVSPFRVKGIGKLKFRLVSPSHARFRGDSRRARLDLAVDGGLALLELEARALDTPAEPWVTLARVQLTAKVDVDQAALRFSPFLTGRGIEPVGFVHALRHGAYAGSQAARPDRADGRESEREGGRRELGAYDGAPRSLPRPAFSAP